jgi:hypothetical protein
MANASSLNTLYSLINGPNANRIGGFIYGAQVDDANRQLEDTRQADARIALGNKQAEYSLASALSRSPETAAMFQPGREVLAPDAYDMASSLMGNVPKMQDAEIASKQADINYKYALSDRARREPVGSGGGVGKTPVDNTTKEQGLIVGRYNTAMNNISSQQARLMADLNRGVKDTNGNAMLSPAAKLKAIAELQRNVEQETVRLESERGRIKHTFGPLITKGMSTPDGQPTPSGEGLVQPTAAPQASTTTAPQSNDRTWHVERAKTALARVTDPARRAEIMATAAKNGVTEQDLAR